MIEEKLDKILEEHVERMSRLVRQPYADGDIKQGMLAFLNDMFPYCRNASLDEAITALQNRSSKEWKPPHIVVQELKEEIK
jgi:hypothetical protein